MQSPNLQELGLRLALHSHNYSVTEALCRINLFTETSDVNLLVKGLRDSFPRFSELNPNFLDWLNIYLFNVCALNQQLIADYDYQLLESTESGPKTYAKGKQITEYNQVISVKNKLKKWFEAVLTFPTLSALLSEANLETLSRDKSARQLLQTIDYLIIKYQLNVKLPPKIREFLQQNSLSSNLSQMVPIYTGVNKKLFCSGEKFASLMDQISQNYQIDLQSIAKLVLINYVEAYPPRIIFNSAQTTGVSFVQELVDYIIRKVPKVDLFSEKMESFRPYELFMAIIFQKEAATVLEWTFIALELIDKSEKDLNLHKKDKVIQKLATFITVYIPTDYPCIHYILKYIYSSLLAKYSSNDSLELMKKLFLNRLLLNPSFFALLMNPSEEDMKQYVSCANSLRLFFYEKKTAALMEQQKNPRILQLSQLLIGSLKDMLSAKENKKSGLNIRDRGVYINDKIVSKIYGQLSDTLITSKNRLQSNSKSNQSVRSQVSLSFSLKNESKSKAGLQSPRTHEHPSVPHVPKPSSRTNLTPKHDISANHSQLPSTESRNQPQLTKQSKLPSDMDQLAQLVNLRREYGELRRDIEGRCIQKRQKRVKRERDLWLLHQASFDTRQQLSGQINQLLINSMLF